ncbi:uncharacterized protein EV420DRAFT_1542224 [Desarmillaria tabescens]|uniref:Uncharacterized protein n=1 Tax=Armillaria tabescens TaxID=1929756 RepID=A0AA39N5Q4_ARMTA|nr:uncharacterized protein EV420DRAFT_1542224 [Desarmillaria tabescens]KAK0458433.1 hypothetical protein EV420DRAFT_1542224 [Desarmillaria tabescens]
MQGTRCCVWFFVSAIISPQNRSSWPIDNGSYVHIIDRGGKRNKHIKSHFVSFRAIDHEGYTHRRNRGCRCGFICTFVYRLRSLGITREERRKSKKSAPSRALGSTQI